ncbi:EAL domain-containing protein [Roseibium sp. RKSG952]|uniref:bifunctional diguanylate cyclase/phosphodiesterase n=1 Tax=Roseibium sp. RKSG952 TaxID=2529384 RepID=UPI0012BD6B77|nr:EAL domain-containing protein [Roseibium sp. RKSG952]MTH99430.1 EAL domain-containing protein [Roseibium sp. RKSG952]
MIKKPSYLNSLAFRVTAILVAVATISIVFMSGLGYEELSDTTEENAKIRVDRAGRTAAALLSKSHAGLFVVLPDATGRPVSIELQHGDPAKILVYSDGYDRLLREIGNANQGAANLFRYNPGTRAFDRFATTFRKPDGSMPPPMSISSGHPAYNSLAHGVMYVGEVPVMGRQRLAYLTPIIGPKQSLAGALAVDVGWADDLRLAERNLQAKMLIATIGILGVIAFLGIILIRREMSPVRRLARFANSVAAGETPGAPPYTDRRDEVGRLAQGLAKVVDLRERLEHLAYTDPITGFGNRAKYLHDLDAVFAKPVSGVKTALAHIDLDGFSKVNDVFGQTLGDKVLVQTAKRLSEAFGPGTKVYRLSGDDFCVLLSFRKADDTPAQGARNALKLLAQPIVLPEADVHVSPAIGITLIPDDAEDAETAHRKTGIALRAAKRSVTGNLTFFSEELNAKAQLEVTLESMLRDAIRSNALTLHFQPQICLRRMRLKGFEALVRWQIDGKYIEPLDFIPIAEKTGLIVELGNWMLGQSCKQARAWANQGLEFDYVAVNVSPIQLWQPRFEQIVRSCLDSYDLPSQYLCLEVTESAFVGHDESRVLDVLRNIRAQGVLLALDDFGSGYSSLSYLNHLPFGQLKIDRAFVSGVSLDINKAKVLKGMVNLAHTLGLKVIAEGAEEADEVSLVRELGCDGVQGFYFGEPVAADQVPALMEQIAKLAPAFRSRHLQTAG